MFAKLMFVVVVFSFVLFGAQAQEGNLAETEGFVFVGTSDQLVRVVDSIVYWHPFFGARLDNKEINILFQAGEKKSRLIGPVVWVCNDPTCNRYAVTEEQLMGLISELNQGPWLIRPQIFRAIIGLVGK